VKSDEKGNFSYQFAEQLHTGDQIGVTAYDEKNGTSRNSYTTELMVLDIEEYVRENSTNLTLNRVTDKSYLISGNFTDKGLVYIAITNGTGGSFKSVINSVETDDFGRFKLRLDQKLDAGSVVYAMERFDNGKIYTANKIETQAGMPDMPTLVKDITNTDNTVQLVGKKGSEVTLTIGEAVYTSTTAEYDAVNSRYVYNFEIDRAISGTKVKASAKNAAGISDVMTSAIVKVAPDQPKVDNIKKGATKITGKIELLDYVAPTKETPEAEGNTETTKKEETPERFKDAPEKVAKTQTRIYAQIGKKYYEGSITNSGKFTIKIPTQKAGTEITVFGMNKAGKGPLIKVVVK
jgi:2',3'-cyclic-nucleotide 2'-phosphodiesterase/3'-nucleotidase